MLFWYYYIIKSILKIFGVGKKERVENLKEPLLDEKQTETDV